MGWIIIGSVIVVAVSLAALYDRRVRRRGGRVDTQPERQRGGPYHYSP